MSRWSASIVVMMMWSLQNFCHTHPLLSLIIHFFHCARKLVPYSPNSTAGKYIQNHCHSRCATIVVICFAMRTGNTYIKRTFLLSIAIHHFSLPLYARWPGNTPVLMSCRYSWSVNNQVCTFRYHLYIFLIMHRDAPQPRIHLSMPRLFCRISAHFPPWFKETLLSHSVPPPIPPACKYTTVRLVKLPKGGIPKGRYWLVSFILPPDALEWWKLAISGRDYSISLTILYYCVDLGWRFCHPRQWSLMLQHGGLVSSSCLPSSLPVQFVTNAAVCLLLQLSSPLTLHFVLPSAIWCWLSVWSSDRKLVRDQCRLFHHTEFALLVHRHLHRDTPISMPYMHIPFVWCQIIGPHRASSSLAFAFSA